MNRVERLSWLDQLMSRLHYPIVVGVPLLVATLYAVTEYRAGHFATTSAVFVGFVTWLPLMFLHAFSASLIAAKLDIARRQHTIPRAQVARDKRDGLSR